MRRMANPTTTLPCYDPAAMPEQETRATEKRPKRRLRVLAFVLTLFVVLFARPAERHLRAASLLVRFASPDAKGFLPDYRRRELDETLIDIPTEKGPVRGRMYAPRGVENAPGVVLVHGVHRLSIEEPRLVRFSRAIAASGAVVLTPEVKEIADYRIDPSSIETIGAAAHALAKRLEGRRVGIMGMSFAGGLGLLAAAEPKFADDVGFVVAIGAHHDLRRVLEFFKTNHIRWPDGHDEALTAHPYGALVLLYSHVERLVPEADVPAARDAIRLWLWEKHDESKKRLADLGPGSREKVEALLEGKADVPKLIEEIARDPSRALAVSPAGRLAGLKAPVFLLHGAGDTVIPAAETSWLETEVPSGLLRKALVTPALVHVELTGEPTASQQWEMVQFMAGVLEAADAN